MVLSLFWQNISPSSRLCSVLGKNMAPLMGYILFLGTNMVSKHGLYNCFWVKYRPQRWVSATFWQKYPPIDRFLPLSRKYSPIVWFLPLLRKSPPIQPYFLPAHFHSYLPLSHLAFSPACTLSSPTFTQAANRLPTKGSQGHPPRPPTKGSHTLGSLFLS